MAIEHDMQPHQETWRGFTKILTYCSAGVAAALILMAIFLL